MRISIFEGLAALPQGETFLQGEATVLEVGEGIREAAYLGLRPDQGQLAPGPLMVSALKADPPERSTHFHLALLSVDGEGKIHRTEGSLEPGILDRLKTRTLVPLTGYGQNYGLVWEDVGNFRTVPPKEAFGKPLREALPEGDAETALRRLIDDSVNLLQDTEQSRKLRDEGKPPANLLWPWGAGIRLPVPNLALQRMTPATVDSASWRLSGLARLAGYRFLPWQIPSKETEADLRVQKLPEDPEEAVYIVRKATERWKDSERAIVLTDGRNATGIRTDRATNGAPFDERLLFEERGGPRLGAWLDEAWSQTGEPAGASVNPIHL